MGIEFELKFRATAQQFAALKFGQPSVLPLSGGEYLLFFWSCVEENYSVQAWKFRFED